MVASVLDGTSIAKGLERGLIARVDNLIKKSIITHLVVILVGDDPASEIYVKNKQIMCQKLGIKSTLVNVSSDVVQDELEQIIEEFNDDDEVHGILVQSPLPKKIDELKIASKILPRKDVDGFNPVNLGRLVQGDTGGIIPCTPLGIIQLLENTGETLEGKRATVLGRSRIVGMPLSILLSMKGIDATVTIVHSKTVGIEKICRESDILISAIGVPNFVKTEWIKDNSIIIDVGISRIEDRNKKSGYSIVGDVEKSANRVASWITPVPGGVGPMTIIKLMENTIRCSELS